MDTNPIPQTKIRCQELQNSLKSLQEKHQQLLTDLANLEKGIYSENPTENLAKLQQLYHLATHHITLAKTFEEKLAECNLEIKFYLKFEAAYNFQKQLYIEKGLLTPNGAYTWEIPGRHQGKSFQLPSWETIKKRLTKSLMIKIETFKEPLFVLYPLGIKVKVVAEKMLQGHGGATGISDFPDEQLQYFPESIDVEGHPRYAMDFPTLMSMADGFLLSVMDGAKEMSPQSYYPGNNRKKLQDLLQNYRLKPGATLYAPSFQQYLAAQIASIAKDGIPLDQTYKLYAGGSVSPKSHLVPIMYWGKGKICFENLRAANQEPGLCRRGSVILW